MRSSGSDTQPRLTRWEIVGAWLHVWTAPKGVEVPPIPWRKLAIGFVLLAIVVGIGLALIIPPLQKGKREGAARVAREQAAAVAAEVKRLTADQKLHTAIAPAGADLVKALDRAITADAKARVARGTLQGSIVGTRCDIAGRYAVRYPHSQVYKCLASTGNFKGEGKDVLAGGYSFVATIYTNTRKLAWCKENPQPGEKTRGHGLAHVRLSAVCAGVLAKLL